MFERPGGGDRALLVALDFGDADPAERMAELGALAVSAGATIAGAVTGRRQRPDAATFAGKGKIHEIATRRVESGAELVIFNHPLTGAQQRNLERALECRVVDRTSLILDIFALRARSAEGKLQVELAQVKHQLTRLVGGWTHLERQKGGIGLRGPGETQLETDRRLLGQRVRVLTKRLEKIRRQRETGRHLRAEIPVPSVALVGYTNAGKSTLFRALTGADAYVADQLFATLDPTVRRISLPGGTTVVVADTVGFIRELPHELVAAFESTLTEAREATLLLHVVDASNPRRSEQLAQVDAVLEEIGARAIPQLIVYNKIDRLSCEPRLDRDGEGRASHVWLSAEEGTGLDLLKQAVAERLSRFARRARLRVPSSAGALRSRLYAAHAVRGESTTADGSIELAVELPDPELLTLARTAGVQILEVEGAGTPSAPADTPCAPGSGFLQSPAASRAGK